MTTEFLMINALNFVLHTQVKNRAEELKRSLDQVITALELYADRVQW